MALEPFCNATLFQSSMWIIPWLQAALTRFDVWLVHAEQADLTIGLGLVVPRRVRRKLFSVDVLFANEAGPSAVDFCVEHNGFLLRREYEEEAMVAMLASLARSLSWDELHFRRAGADALLRVDAAQLDRLGLRLRTDESTVAPYVDLDAVRKGGSDFFAGLTSNRRAQLRRALRILEREGPVRVTEATDEASAMACFSALKGLHQRCWEARGEPGAFANPGWETFHRNLIRTQLAHGGVQLLHVAAGETTVGYIYSLVRAGSVYMIQSGFNYGLDPKAHPGECCHALAIEWNVKAGHRVYDFLGGDMRYKRSLANGVASMSNVVFQRKRWRFLVEDEARRLYRRIRELFKIGLKESSVR